MSAQACSPQGGLAGDSLDGKERSARNQAVDGIGHTKVLDGVERYPLSAAPMAWSERQKLLASDRAAGDHFGQSVSISGDSVIVGAGGDDDAGSGSGAAYVLTRSATTWTQQAKLVAGDATGGDIFGQSVSLSGDTAIVGAGSDGDAGFNAGSIYAFVRSATGWGQQEKLLANDAGVGDSFGQSVSLSGDAVIVGAYKADDAGSDAGSAYVFVRNAAIWTQQAKLIALDGAADDFFGSSVSLSGDTAIVGAYQDDDAGSLSGSAYVFVRSAAIWAQEAKLVAGDSAANDYFGRSVSLNGETAIVGADGSDGVGTFSGSAYVFVRSATSWAQQAKLVAGDDTGGVAFFGRSVSLSGDIAIVGAHQDNDADTKAGSAYVFARSAALWTEQAKLLASDASSNDHFGQYVSLSGDTALVGAWGEGAWGDNAVGNDSGAAYVFALRLDDGQSCVGDEACVSKFCVGGFCCDSVCDGACEACNVAGSEGLCTLAGRGAVPTASCNGHLCDGASGACPNGCAGDEDCTSTHHCPGAVACMQKKVDGQSCTANNVCSSGHCVDGVCCEEACDEGCGSCIVAGLEGACTPLEKGYPGTPSCAPYLCDGGNASCPGDCGAHGDCAPDGHCSESVCLSDLYQGVVCSDDDACTTGYCTDGVCCLVDACGAYRCGPGGACDAACSSSAQCAGGHECNSARVCEPVAPSQGEASEGGACHLASVSAASHGVPPWRWLDGLAWLAALGLVRRRRLEGGQSRASAAPRCRRMRLLRSQETSQLSSEVGSSGRDRSG